MLFLAAMERVTDGLKMLTADEFPTRNRKKGKKRKEKGRNKEGRRKEGKRKKEGRKREEKRKKKRKKKGGIGEK